jgi:hypothetical protein
MEVYEENFKGLFGRLDGRILKEERKKWKDVGFWRFMFLHNIKSLIFREVKNYIFRDF